jgi:hypothetical protein
MVCGVIASCGGDSESDGGGSGGGAAVAGDGAAGDGNGGADGSAASGGTGGSGGVAGGGGTAATDGSLDGSGCTSQEKICGGKCVSATDPANGCAQASCSACAIANGTATCSATGECAVGSCASGFGNCNGQDGDGCEQDLLASTAHCGACNAPCSVANGTPSCDNGVCKLAACNSGYSDCQGACVDLSKDPKNCGKCGNACGAGELCCAGACVVTAGCGFSVSALTPPYGWLNGGDWITVKGAGFAKGLRVEIGAGRAPTRVIDANTALIQTPPGSAGTYDVKITLGAQTAVLKNGFDYQSAGIGTTWQLKPMSVVRGEDPGLTVLQDGRALVAGGTTVPDSAANTLDTAELFDPMTTTMSAAKNKMSTRRWQNSAVTLLTGKALVVGGWCSHYQPTACPVDAKKADLFDPTTDTFSPSASTLNIGRVTTRAVLLPDGRVFIASANDASVEIYDPETDTFKLVNHTQLHVFGFVVRLKDGRVLIGGGDGGVTAAEIFDPDTDSFQSVGALQQSRSMLTAHTLPDGRVLVIGGSSVSAGGINAPRDTMELFDPTTGTFSLASYKLSVGRTWHASALVRDGTVLVMGGYYLTGSCTPMSDTVDRVNPVAGTTSAFAKLPAPATEWNATTLLTGSVLAVGGGACGTPQALPNVYFLPES